MVGGAGERALGRAPAASCSRSPTGRACCAIPSSRRAHAARARAGGDRATELADAASRDSLARCSRQPDDGVDQLEHCERGRRRLTRARGTASAGSRPWRHKLAEPGVERRRATASATPGLRVSSLCRGGVLRRAAGARDRRQPARDRRGGRRSAPTCWCSSAAPAPDSRPRGGARDGRRTASSDLLPYAAEHGVRLGDRAAAPDVSRRPLGDRDAARGARPRRAVRRAERRRGGRRLPRLVGPATSRGRSRAPAARIVGYHVNDWLVPASERRAARPRDDGRRRDRAAGGLRALIERRRLPTGRSRSRSSTRRSGTCRSRS